MDLSMKETGKLTLWCFDKEVHTYAFMNIFVPSKSSQSQQLQILQIKCFSETRIGQKYLRNTLCLCGHNHSKQKCQVTCPFNREFILTEFDSDSDILTVLIIMETIKICRN